MLTNIQQLSAHKRTEDSTQREDLARVDRFIDYSRNQLLQNSAAANATGDEVIEPGFRKPILSDSIPKKFWPQLALDALRKLTQPAQIARGEGVVRDFRGNFAGLHRLAYTLAGKRKGCSDAFS